MKVLTSKDYGCKYRVIRTDDTGFKVSNKYVLVRAGEVINDDTPVKEYIYTFETESQHGDIIMSHSELAADGIALVPDYLFDKNNNVNTLEVGRYYIKIKRKSSAYQRGIYLCINKGINSRGYEYGYFVNVLKRTNAKCEDFIDINSDVSLWCSNTFLIKETFANYMKRLKEGKSE